MKKILNILFWVFILYVVGSKIPAVYSHFKQQNTPAPNITVETISGELISFPQSEKKTILIFWATWCGPCKVEMNRLSEMMKQGEIHSDQLVAINIQESKEDIMKFLNENSYPFVVALDPRGEIANQFKVEGTPTIVFLDERGYINWITTGLSPLLSQRVKRFLNN